MTTFHVLFMCNVPVCCHNFCHNCIRWSNIKPALNQSVMIVLHRHSLTDCLYIIVSIVGSLRDREVACSASDRQGSNFESCVWRTVSSQSSHHPQEVLLAQFSLYVHKGGLKPDSFHFICNEQCWYYTDYWFQHAIGYPCFLCHIFSLCRLLI